MRFPRLPLLLLLASLLTAQAQTEGASSTQIFNQGQKAYMAGDIATAKAKFTEVLVLDPKHLPSKNYLKMIAISEKGGNKGELAQKLSKLTIEKVSFKDADLGSVLDYLKIQAERASNGEVKTSFVLQLPPGYATDTKLTLELAKVPFTELLRYIGDLTATKFSIEQYAIVVKKA